MKYVVGNWKMHLGVRESVALARGILRHLRGKEEAPEVIICPAFTALSEVHKVLARSRVSLGAQNCGPERAGAFTGEVSVGMLEDAGASHVLLGHSERRVIFGESDELIRKKLEIAFESKLQPILAVGEPAESRDAGEAKEYVEGQLQTALTGLAIPRRHKVMVAYEPVWAIGSGETPSVGEIVEMHAHMRRSIAQLTSLPEKQIVILYGGSVTGENAYSFLRESEVDGLLVGGASLKLAQFTDILDAGTEVVTAQI